MFSAKTLKLGALFVGVLLLAGIFLFTRIVFGTYSLPEAAQLHRQWTALQRKYHMMFKKRESLRYHIGWAESRGDDDEARKLARDLEALDDDIDAVEVEIKLWKNGGAGKAKKDHVL